MSKLWQSAWGYQALLLIMALGSGAMLWYFDHQTFSVASVQQLWRSAFTPQSGWDALLHPLQANPERAMVLMTLLSSVSLMLFCAVALQLGLSRQTTFALFLLMNFNPEYNDVRLSLDVFQLILPLWLLGLWGLLAHYRRARNHAILMWTICWLLGVLLEPATMLVGLGFPLCFAFWERKSAWRWAWWLGYELLCVLLLCAIPHTRLFILQLFQDIGLWYQLSPEQLVQLGKARISDLSALEIGTLAFGLVLLNVARCSGLVMLGLVAVALRAKITSVLMPKVQYFLWFGLFFVALVWAFLWLYQGRWLGDLAYMPLVMMVLLLTSSAVFYGLERLQRLPEQYRLLCFWAGMSYALASMISFGPSAGHFREAGMWARGETVYSNNAQVLFYAGQSPLPDSPHYMTSLKSWLQTQSASSSVLVLYSQHRRAPPPEGLSHFEVLQTFANAHGDQVYALRYRP